MLTLVLSPLFLRAEEWRAPTPVIEEFSGQKYKEWTWDPTFRGYSLGEVCITPSREWIVFLIHGNLRRPDRDEPVAVGAYRVSSGLKRQLVFSLPRGESAWTTQILESLRRDFVPMGGNRVGIVTMHMPLHRKDGEPDRGTCAATGPVSLGNPEGGNAPAPAREKYFLWEWDLERDNARLVGPWDYAMISIAQVLDLGQCNICWTSDRESTNGELRLFDLASRKNTMVSLNPEVQVAAIVMQTYARTADPCAFAVCDPLPPDGVQVYCVDPNAPNGIRWRWDKAALQDAVGPNIKEAGFLRKVSHPCQQLPLLVYSYSVDGKKCSVYLVFLDERTGRIARGSKIPLDVSVTLPIISSDNRWLVDNIDGLDGLEDEGEHEDSSEDGLLCTRLRIIDLDSGKYRDTANLYKQMQLCWLGGFLDGDRAVLSDEHAVWILDTGKDLRLRELFRLNELETFKESGKAERVNLFETPACRD